MPRVLRPPKAFLSAAECTGGEWGASDSERGMHRSNTDAAQPLSREGVLLCFASKAHRAPHGATAVHCGLRAVGSGAGDAREPRRARQARAVVSSWRAKCRLAFLCLSAVPASWFALQNDNAARGARTSTRWRILATSSSGRGALPSTPSRWRLNKPEERPSLATSDHAFVLAPQHATFCSAKAPKAPAGERRRMPRVLAPREAFSSDAQCAGGRGRRLGLRARHVSSNADAAQP